MTEVFQVNRSERYQSELIVHNTSRGDSDYSEYDSYSDMYNRSAQRVIDFNKRTEIANKLSEINCMYKPMDSCIWERGLYKCNDIPLNGLVEIDSIGYILSNKRNSSRATTYLYFWHGNIMKGKEDYMEAIIFNDEYKDSLTPKEILHNIGQYFAFPYFVPKSIGGDDDIMYDNILKDGKTELFSGSFSPLFTAKLISFNEGKVTNLILHGTYTGLPTVEKFSDDWPEEFASWKIDYDAIMAMKPKKDVENDNPSGNIICECPSCMGTKYDNQLECKECKGTGVVTGEDIDKIIEKIGDISDVVVALAEESKVHDALEAIVESGISLLEEPEILGTTRRVLIKLYKIKNILTNA